MVAVARLLTLPASLWEYDEVLFVRGVERFEPLAYRPHPPGYPLLIGLGKVATALTGDAFRGLVALSVLASLVGYLAAVEAFAAAWEPGRRGALGPGPRAERDAAGRVPAAVAGALLFALSPPMLVYGPLALSDPPALAFVALALAAAGRWLRQPGALWAAAGCGAAAAAAVGCRPQLVIAIAPMLVVLAAMVVRRARAGGAGTGHLRGVLAAAGAFVAVASAWAVPLVLASGGLRALAKLFRGQAGLVAANDASLSRAGASVTHLVGRFVVDPWGPRWAAAIVLVLAVAGAVLLVRRRGGGALPLLVFAGADLAFALAVMNPPDAARYAMPSMLGVAFLAGGACAAVARSRARATAALVLPAALIAGFVVYCWPLLRQRTTTPSPTVQAAAWAKGHLPDGALVLYERELESHALELLPQWKRLPADERISVSARRPVFLLAEGRSGAAAGATFEWTRDPAWRRLTRGHLGVVSWTPVSGARLFEPLAGVYGPEPSALAWLTGKPDGEAWRWLADRASLRVVPGDAAALSLGLRLPTNAPYSEVTVTLDVAGTRQAPVRLARGETVALRLPLPRARRVRVDIDSDRSFLPAAAGVTSGDRRRLAVQLVRCELVDFGGASVDGSGGP